MMTYQGYLREYTLLMSSVASQIVHASACCGGGSVFESQGKASRLLSEISVKMSHYVLPDFINYFLLNQKLNTEFNIYLII